MKKYVISVITFLMILLPGVAFADTPYELSFKVYKCDMENGKTAVDCYTGYLAGTIESYKVSEGGNLDPNSTLLVIPYMKIGTPKTMTSFQMYIDYDTNALEPVVSDGAILALPQDSSNLPGVKNAFTGKYTYNWALQLNQDGDQIKIIGMDETSFLPLENDFDIAYIFFNVKSDVKAGSSVSLSYDMDPGSTNGNDASSNLLSMSAVNSTFSIYGAQSRDASLKTLTVTNGNITYPLDPTFTPGNTNNTTYYTTVPNNVDSINLDATVNNEYAGIDDSLGNKTLNVGDNVFDIVVTSQLGYAEIYQIHVYRLSNDATLSSLTLTNGVSIGSIIPGVYTYTASIPYSISNTNVSAKTTHTNAFVQSGIDDWELTNSGATLNTKSVIVKAENCLDEYANVEGNTCNTQTYTIEITRAAASTNNNLSSLTVDGNSVPDFNKDTTEYTLPNVSTTTTEMEIGAIVEDTGKAKIKSGTGKVQLNIGDNTFKVVVEAENGTTKTYTIKVRRLSNNYNLSNLIVTSNPEGTLSPDFSNSFYNTYTYTYDPTVTSITITATAEDTGKAMVSLADISTDNTVTGTPVLNTNSGTYNVSTTKVAVTVTAEDGTVWTYPINLTRLKSSNNYLSDLSLSEGTLSPGFISTTRSYTATVDGSVENVDVYATKAVEYSEIISITGNDNLKFGVNTIEVKVKAEDGATASYVINLTREKYTIATLSDLKVDGNTIKDFDSSKTEYTLDNVSFDKTSIRLNPIKSNEYATVVTKVNGNIVNGETVNLSTGDNEIVVTVTAQDETTVKDYTINVYREKNSDNSVHGLTVAGKTPTLNDEGKYEVTLPNSKDTLNPSDVIISISDDATLQKGNSISLSTDNINTWQFTVTSENNIPKTYTILITREPSTDTSISKITLTIGEDSSRYCLMEGDSCKIAVPVETTDFSLSAAIHEKASISPINGTKYTMDSSESIKNVTLTVTAEDGVTTKDYTVVVERQKSSNTNLKSLKYNNISVTDFNSGTLVYNETVPGITEKVSITAEVEDTGKATITTDLTQDFALNFGSNKIEVEVKAENGDTKKYTIMITRKNRVDATLKDLTINGTTISGFNSGITSYVLSDVDYNMHQLYIVATPNDDLASASGDGLVSINTGSNKIDIIVTAHDTNVKKTYTINVNRKLNDNTNIQSISLAGNKASYNETTGNYEVTVPNDVTQANTSNLIVQVADPATETDKKATYSFLNTDLVTTNTNSITITVTAENQTSTKDYVLVVTREKSNVATLSSLTVTNGSFNPSFNSEKLEYEVIVPVDTTQFDVSATPTEEHATVSGDGHFTMNASTMKIEVVVTSEDESVSKTYKLNIAREKSSINTLSGITVSEGTLNPIFDEETTSYTVNVDGSITSIDIGATLTDDRATILSGVDTHNLNVGDNKIIIVVQSESGAKREYIVNVVRAKKADNNLATLTVDGISVPNFDEDTLEYTLDQVPNSKTSIEIDATTKDSDAKITSGTGKQGLKTGQNQFDIVVEAQNGTPKTYTIYITREKSSNAKLSLLSVNGYVLVPAFDSEIYDYEVEVDSTKETLSPNEITAIAEDNNATIKLQDTINLSTTVDNYYKVEVTAEDGIAKETYTIKVIRPKSSDATLSSVNVTGATITPTFDSSKTDYTLTVPYGSTDFSIEGIPNVKTTSVFGNGDYTINNNVVTLTTHAEDGTTKVYTFTVVQALSNDATLATLSINGYKFDKTFNSTVLNYNIGNVPFGTTKLIVNATANNLNSDVKYYVDNVLQDSNIVNIPDSLGTKKITVKVTAPDGLTEKSYDISYTLIASSNAYLSNLVPSIGTIDFVKTTENYSLTVDNDVTSISFDITTEDVNNASISVNGGNHSFTPKTETIQNLVVGNNPVSILVTAHDGTTKTYNVIVKRLEKQASNDANLSNLSVTGYSFDKTFKMEELEYSLGKIPFSTTQLTVNATANYGTSTINYLVNGIKQNSNIVNIPKEEGIGVITVKVTAEDGKTVKNYKITYEKVASTNAYLDSIVVSEGTLDFNKNTFAYTVNVGKDITSIDITAKTQDATAIMQMNGVTYSSPHTLTLSPLYSGNTEVKILVTAENGNVITYKVVVKKESDILSTITSNDYGHTILNGNIKTVKLGITGLQMKEQLDNENKYLQIWTADESRQVDDNETLATGMIVKLIIDGEEKDRKFIVIKGDTNGDGEIDLFDAVVILNHYLEKTLVNGPYKEASYVNDDEDIDLFDSVKILNHYLEKDLLH